jgi:hypothetical protein
MDLSAGQEPVTPESTGVSETAFDIGADDVFIEVESEPGLEPASGAAAGGPPAPAGSRQPQTLDEVRQIREDAQRALREANEIRASLAPYMQRLVAETSRPEDTPPVSLDKVQAGNLTYEEFLKYNEWQQNRNNQRLLTMAQDQAAKVASEQKARGYLSASTLGEGRDYDTMVGKHIAPIYRTNPQLKDLIHTVFSKEPALGEYYLAVMLEGLEKFNDNPIELFKAINGAANARQEGSREASISIRSAANRAADKLLQPGGGARPRQKLTAADIARMSDDEFQRLYQAIDRGLVRNF